MPALVMERECEPLVNASYDTPANEPVVYGDTCGTGTGLYVDGRPWGALGVGIGIGIADIDVDEPFVALAVAVAVVVAAAVVVIPRPPFKVWP